MPLLGVPPLPPSLRDRFAAETGLPEHPDAAAVYSAWMALFPYDTVEKILAIADGIDLPGTNPSATVERALTRTGTGGTCTAGAMGLAWLLAAFGHRVELVACAVDKPTRLARELAKPSHLGVRVTDESGGQWWLDTAAHHLRPLRIAAAPDRVASGAWADEAGFRRPSLSGGVGREYTFRYAHTLRSAEDLFAFAKPTATGLDWDQPFFLARPALGVTLLGGRAGWTSKSHADGRLTPVDGRTVLAEAGVARELAGRVLAAC